MAIIFKICYNNNKILNRKYSYSIRKGIVDYMNNYDRLFSKQVINIKPSGIRKFFEYANSDSNIISLGVGEPDFNTSDNVVKAAVNSLNRGDTCYSSNLGLIELRRKVSEYIAKAINLDYNPENEILITVGCSEAIDITIRTFVNPGDEVIIVQPCFVAYAPLVQLAGGIPVFISTKSEDNFTFNVDQLLEKITDKTKLLIISFPSNPTGAIMKKSDLEKISKVISKRDIMVMSDEVYSELTYDGKHFSIAECDGMRDKTIVINGFSKAFAMTGWRLGYLVAPRIVVEQMTKIHQYAIMCAPTISQNAALEALTSCANQVSLMKDIYLQRRDYIYERLTEMGLETVLPGGAFYIFPSIKCTGISSEQFCTQLIKNYKLAVIPGNAFGDSGEGYVRISYSYSMEHIEEAMNRLETYLSSLKVC